MYLLFSTCFSCICPSETDSHHTTQKPLVSFIHNDPLQHPQSNMPQWKRRWEYFEISSQPSASAAVRRVWWMHKRTKTPMWLPLSLISAIQSFCLHSTPNISSPHFVKNRGKSVERLPGVEHHIPTPSLCIFFIFGILQKLVTVLHSGTGPIYSN